MMTADGSGYQTTNRAVNEELAPGDLCRLARVGQTESVDTSRSDWNNAARRPGVADVPWRVHSGNGAVEGGWRAAGAGDARRDEHSACAERSGRDRGAVRGHERANHLPYPS